MSANGPRRSCETCGSDASTSSRYRIHCPPIVFIGCPDRSQNISVTFLPVIQFTDCRLTLRRGRASAHARAHGSRVEHAAGPNNGGETTMVTLVLLVFLGSDQAQC